MPAGEEEASAGAANLIRAAYISSRFQPKVTSSSTVGSGDINVNSHKKATYPIEIKTSIIFWL